MRRFTLRSAVGETTGIAFGTEGSPDLVFLHATGFNALTYRSLLAPLGQDFRVVALDLRGHGLSPLPADPDAMDTWRIYPRDFLRMLPALMQGGAPPVLAGHSMGGATVLTATAAKPGIAERLVLLDPVLATLDAVRRAQRIPGLAQRIPRLPIAQGAARRRAEFASKQEAAGAYRGRAIFASWADPFVDDYVEDGFVPDPHNGVTLACAPQWEAATFAGLRHYAAPLLARVKCPVTILKAASEAAVRVDDALLRRFKPDVAIETVPDSSHFLPMEQPDLVRMRLRAALETRAGR
ncbi:alpha/beta fold hydrolase [Desertibaculum subflavum]|uniref:alpha/beta fold hydrolase n=1 Tax=Desertibaculum subflavum TaxID=2268458 RepID=UPI000E66AB11